MLHCSGGLGKEVFRWKAFALTFFRNLGAGGFKMFLISRSLKFLFQSL